MADRAVIRAGKPGEIKDELVVDIEGVRERHDPRVQAMRTRLMDAFQQAAGVQIEEEQEEEHKPHIVKR
jgi:ABC-type nitrate/sulfonate/bicarbonate transport system ATPase subunit